MHSAGGWKRGRPCQMGAAGTCVWLASHRGMRRFRRRGVNWAGRSGARRRRHRSKAGLKPCDLRWRGREPGGGRVTRRTCLQTASRGPSSHTRRCRPHLPPSQPPRPPRLPGRPAGLRVPAGRHRRDHRLPHRHRRLPGGGRRRGRGAGRDARGLPPSTRRLCRRRRGRPRRPRLAGGGCVRCVDGSSRGGGSCRCCVADKTEAER